MSKVLETSSRGLNLTSLSIIKESFEDQLLISSLQNKDKVRKGGDRQFSGGKGC